MTLAFSHPDPAIAALVAHAMEAAGIDSVLRGLGYGAAMGEIPPVASWAEVWIADPARFDEAAAIARASMTDAPGHPLTPWTCASCGERVDRQFGACWQCGTPSPITDA